MINVNALLPRQHRTKYESLQGSASNETYHDVGTGFSRGLKTPLHQNSALPHYTQGGGEI